METKPIVKNYMTTQLITLSQDMDVYFAIGLLLKNRISGAPVTDNNHHLVGILSEKDCLRIFANGSFYDMPGGLVNTIISGMSSAGLHKVKWNGTNMFGETVPSGIYFCEMNDGSRSDIIKLILMK